MPPRKARLEASCGTGQLWFVILDGTGPTLEIRAASGFGARFSAATNEFIGFITPGL